MVVKILWRHTRLLFGILLLLVWSLRLMVLNKFVKYKGWNFNLFKFVNVSLIRVLFFLVYESLWMDNFLLKIMCY